MTYENVTDEQIDRFVAFLKSRLAYPERIELIANKPARNFYTVDVLYCLENILHGTRSTRSNWSVSTFRAREAFAVWLANYLDVEVTKSIIEQEANKVFAEFDAIAEKHSRIAAANERVANLKASWREGKGANMTLAEKLAALRKAADGKITI